MTSAPQTRAPRDPAPRVPRDPDEPISLKALGSSLGFGELVAMLATIMALAAFATDMMLPALPMIGADLKAPTENDRQLLVPVMFLGMAFAQIFYGPILDAFGRKRGLYIGLTIFLVGTLTCIFAPNFQMMLVGRLLQGVGAAGPQVMAMAATRDLFVGRSMARVTSLIMMIFMVVPVFAPMLGAQILRHFDWHMIFWVFALHALVAWAWSWTRLPETLPPERRRPLSAKTSWAAFKEMATHPVSIGYVMASGFIFSSLVAYLTASEQVLGELYAWGPDFVYPFGAGAVAIGLASFANSKFVVRFGMRKLSQAAMTVFVILAAVGLTLSLLNEGKPPFWAFMTLLCGLFFCCGLIFGNLRALAMEPMGHIAGMAAGAGGSISTLVSALIGGAVARGYDGSVTPFFAGFVGLASMAWVCVIFAERGRARLAQGAPGARS